ncbi:unnamed protein product [Microthlaspi erraticum]|uniref:NPH3 domain-containing protein n=1 Tax=Microthlaspi erraticum TaxID=1685480 RepID=A0A6D2IL34_9BRAS|nr:unnamed protein product [Microthlaspi erraticum]
MALSSTFPLPLLFRFAAPPSIMTEEYSPDNLISKMGSQSRLGSLGITEQCIASIVSRASSADPSLFGWPVNDGGGGRGAGDTLIPGAASKTADVRRKKQSKDSNMELWFEDLAQLSLPIFITVIVSMRSGDLSLDVIESCLICYAKKQIPRIFRSNRKPPPSSSTAASEN